MAFLFEGYVQGGGTTGTTVSSTPSISPTTTSTPSSTGGTAIVIGNTTIYKSPTGSVSIIPPLLSNIVSPPEGTTVVNASTGETSIVGPSSSAPTITQPVVEEPEEEIISLPTGQTYFESLLPQNQFIASITGTQDKAAESLQQEKMIYEETKEAPLVMLPEGQREWAITSLIGTGELTYGTEGIKPVISTPDTSPFLSKYGYSPYDVDYSKTYNELDQSISSTKQYIQDLKNAVSESETAIPKLESNIKLVEGSDEDSMWYDPRDPSGEKLISKTELLGLLKTNLSEWETTRAMGSDIQKYQKNLNDLLSTKETVKLYEKEGYLMDVGSTGEFSFRLPSAYEAHVGLFGEERTTAMLGSAAFLESPLGLKMLAQYGTTAITGDKSFAEAEREDLAAYSLGLSSALKKGGAEFGKEVLLSPAMVQGVYLPAVTLGAGYGLTGLSAGASGASQVGTLARIGGTTGGKILLATGKTGMLVAGGVGIASTGIALGQTGGLTPERLPGLLTETGFTFGLAAAGYKGGQKSWIQKNTGSYQYNWKSGKMEWTPYEIPKSEVSIGKQNILEFKYPEKNVFYAKGSEITSAKKGTIFEYEAYGGEKLTGKEPGSPTIIEGSGKVSWTEKAPGIRGLLGEKVSHTKLFDLTSTSEPVEAPKGYQGDLQFSRAEGSTTFRSGGKTDSEGIIASLNKGKIKPGQNDVLISPLEIEGVGGSKVKIGLPNETQFSYFGKYEGSGGRGTQMDFGNVYSWEFGSPKAQTGGAAKGNVGSGGKTFGSLVSQQISKLTGGDVTTITTPKAPVVGSGGSGAAVVMGGSGGVTLQDYGSLGIAPGHSVTTGVTLYDIHGMYSKPKTRYDSGWALLSPIASKPTEDESDLLSGFRFDYGTKDGFLIGPKTDWDVNREERSNEDQFPGIDFFVIDIQKPDVDQRQKQQQEQLQELVSLNQYETLTVVTPIDKTPFEMPRITYPKIFKQQKEESSRKKLRITKKEPRPQRQPGKQNIGLYADILSVTRSQARYGKATHPKVTRKLWSIGEKTSFLRVPTMELIREKSKSKARRRKRKKYVFY